MPTLTLPARPTPAPASRLPERLTPQGSPAEPGDALPFPQEHRVPTMLNQRELNYLYWLGASLPEHARVVELGCFLGGSTAALIEGMRTTGRHYPQALVYDAFLAPGEEHVNSWWMKPFGLSAHENFRSRYEALHASRLDRLRLHEGWIPERLARESEASLYPEQAPIDLLFVDAAKTWGVHQTILRAFGRHLRPGSIVVQQDFVDINTPWLPLHMWQFREHFRPLDAVRASPTISFECVADPAGVVDSAWDLSRFEDHTTREAVWAQVIDFWSSILTPDAAGFLHGHAAKHAALFRDRASVLTHARLYEAWLRSSGSVDMYQTPGWQDILARLITAVDPAAGTPHQDAELATLAAEVAVRATLPRHSHDASTRTYFAHDDRVGHWADLKARLRSAGHTRIALFAAGRHTEWLLTHNWTSADPTIACILDDSSNRSSIGGVPVHTVAHAREALAGVTALVPSSDSMEPALLARLAELRGQGHLTTLEVFTVYTAAIESISAAITATPAATLREPDAPLVRVPATSLQSSSPHREALGLPVERAWLETFAQRNAAPAWAKGYVNTRDALFLWDLIEAIRPDHIIEVGTASGVSTGSLAQAADFFGGTTLSRGHVHTFDIASRCYFDARVPVGQAALDAHPHLAEIIHLNPQRNAADAAGRFGVASIDLAFIDGDHRHPAPTLDLIALLYAMKPGAWVALHDIELTAVAAQARSTDWGAVTGAEMLFKRWPFQKIQPRFDNPTWNNIGAIKLPHNLARAAEFLLDLLEVQWETGQMVPTEITRALALRRRLGLAA